MLPRRQIPNAITVARLALTAGCIACLSMVSISSERLQPWLSLGLLLFVTAAITDWVDGYLARRWDVVSKFGRVMDPLADKVLILGVFIVLAGPGFAQYLHAHGATTIEVDGQTIQGDFVEFWPYRRLMTFSGVLPWMVVLMLTRELLVTGLRSVMESSGAAFGAVTLGKLKMALQSFTIPVILIVVALDPYEPGHRWMIITRDALLYATVLVTVLSAWPYVAASIRTQTERNAEPA